MQGHYDRGSGKRSAMPANTVVLANTRMEIYEGRVALPYSAEWVRVPRDPDCLVCGHLHRAAEEPAVDVSLDELAGMGNVTFEDDSEG